MAFLSLGVKFTNPRIQAGVFSNLKHICQPSTHAKNPALVAFYCENNRKSDKSKCPIICPFNSCRSESILTRSFDETPTDSLGLLSSKYLFFFFFFNKMLLSKRLPNPPSLPLKGSNLITTTKISHIDRFPYFLTHDSLRARFFRHGYHYTSIKNLSCAFVFQLQSWIYQKQPWIIFC